MHTWRILLTLLWRITLFRTEICQNYKLCHNLNLPECLTPVSINIAILPCLYLKILPKDLQLLGFVPGRIVGGCSVGVPNRTSSRHYFLGCPTSIELYLHAIRTMHTICTRPINYATTILAAVGLGVKHLTRTWLVFSNYGGHSSDYNLLRRRIIPSSLFECRGHEWTGDTVKILRWGRISNHCAEAARTAGAVFSNTQCRLPDSSGVVCRWVCANSIRTLFCKTTHCGVVAM